MSRKRSAWLGGAIASASLAAALGALAQEAPKSGQEDGKEARAEPAPEEEAAATRFVEAFAASDWAKAVEAHRALITRWPARAKEAGLNHKLALALFRLGRGKEATATLEGMLAADEDDVNALHLLALVELAETDHPASREDKKTKAKEHLLRAARNGFFVLREIANARRNEYGDLREDPAFIMACMKASQDVDAKAVLAGVPGKRPVRNPFDIPKEGFPPSKEKPEGAGPAPAPVKKPTDPAALLRHDLDLGNGFLKEMILANREEDEGRAYKAYEKLAALVEEMRREPYDEFRRNADALAAAGKKLRAEAETLEKITKLKLEVTGICLDPGGKNRGVIVYDDPDRRGRVYQAGDEIRDREDRRVANLRVVAISEGLVRFRFDEREFVRPLRTPTKG